MVSQLLDLQIIRVNAKKIRQLRIHRISEDQVLIYDKQQYMTDLRLGNSYYKFIIASLSQPRQATVRLCKH